MSLTMNVNRNDLLTSLSSLQNVTAKKGNMAILANVLLQAEGGMLLMTGTDLEVGVRISVPAEIITPGTITLPCRKFFEVIRETPAETVRVEVLDNQQAKISAGKSEYRLGGTPSEEFPSFPEYKEESMVTLPSELLAELIDKTIFSLAPEGESQFNLTSLLLEKEKRDGTMFLRTVSSDGHRLSLMEKEAPADVEKLVMGKTVLIPRKGVQETRKFCDLGDTLLFGLEEKQAVVKSGNALLIIRLMQGDFPDYRNILAIIKKENPVVVDRAPFMNSMKRMNIFAEDKYNMVHFNIKGSTMMLSSQSVDLGDAKDEVEIDYSGQDLNLGFNGRYYLETMQAMHSDKVKAYINSEESPCLVAGDDDPGFMSIIMPMKV